MDIQDSEMQIETSCLIIKSEIDDNESNQELRQEDAESVSVDVQLEESAKDPEAEHGISASCTTNQIVKLPENPKAKPSKRKYKTFICACGNSYYTYSLLTYHKKVCKDDRNCTCPQCKKNFMSPQQLVRHLKSHLRTVKRKRTFKCRVIACPPEFQNKVARDTHEPFCIEQHIIPPDQIIIEGVKMFMCRKTLACEKAFFNERSRTLHEEACELPDVKMEISVEESRIEPGSPDDSCLYVQEDNDSGTLFLCQREGCEQHFSCLQSREAHETSCLGRDILESVDRYRVAIDGVELYVCDICGEAIESQDMFREHKAECTEDEDVIT